MGHSKLIFATFVFCGIFPFITGDARVYLKHHESEKYVGKFNGTNKQRVPLVKSPKDAQLFTVVLENRKGLLLTVRQGNRILAYVDKLGGCASPSKEIIYYVDKSDDNQLFTLNNDGTIGSRCCKHCLVHPTPDVGRLVLREYNCIRECNESYIFEIFLENELPKA